MRKRVPHACLLAAGLAALALPAFLEGKPAEGEPKAQGPTPSAAPVKDQVPFSADLSLPRDAHYQKKLDAVADYVKEEAWDEAARVLQGLLDSKDDVFVPLAVPGPEGKDTIRWTSARAEANRLLGELPGKALEFYEANYGPQAARDLADARRQNDPELLAHIAQRYFHTKAGLEATQLLGTYYLDRGRFVMAALCFERLLARKGASPDPATLFRASLALRRAGDKGGADKLWKRLADKAPGGVRLGERLVELDDLRKELDDPKVASRQEALAHDWPVFGGGPARSASGAGGLPVFEAKWQQPASKDAAGQGWLRYAVLQHEGRGLPVLPALFPVAAGGKVIYRTQHGVQAVDAKTGKLAWESAPGWGLDHLLADSAQFSYVQGWVNSHLQNYPGVLFENAVVGQLSADASQAYAVHDLAVPPYVPGVNGVANRSGQALHLALSPALNDALYHNRLQAIDLASGKLVWEAGGRTGVGKGAPTSPVHDGFFLGPPLPLGGKLYALFEKDQDVRLVCLDAADGSVQWAQTLGSAKTKLMLEGGRRIQAAPVAYGQGLLVCPTNAAGVVAVDLLSHSLVWAYAYREEPPPKLDEVPTGRRPARVPLRVTPPNYHTDWKTSAPVVAEDKVVLTPPDAPAVHCLNLQDGALVWKVSRGDDDLYLAGVARGRVLLVGKQFCRALRLADGKELWRTETGVPSGHGQFAGGDYYLPLAKAAEDKGPAVCVLDVDTGAVKERVPAPRGEAPGNLLWYADHVISQTPTAVTAYPARKAEGRKQKAEGDDKEPEVRRPKLESSRDGMDCLLPSAFCLLLGDVPADGGRIAKLVAQLGSQSYAEREEATQTLNAVGGPALEALRKAVQGPDPEVRCRAEFLVRQIERRVESARLLTPFKVRLVYNDTLVTDAIADLAKKTGFKIEVQGNTARLTGRKVTLDTGEVTFWEAVDQLCQKAGLVEHAPVADNRGGSGTIMYSQSITINGNRVTITNSDRRDPSEEGHGRLVLRDGKPAALPTHYAGALRVSALPPETPPRGQEKVAGQVVFGLNVTPEPRMQWQRVLGVRIDRAIDDQDQALAQVVNPVKDAPQTTVQRGGLIVNGMPLTYDEGPTGNQREVPVRLERGAKPAKTLKELTGTITAQVQTAPEPLMVIDDVLKAKDQVARSPAGGTLKVVEVEQQDDGKVRLRLHLGAPPKRMDSGTAAGFDGVTLVNGRAVGEVEESIGAGPANFTLLDAEGRPVPFVRGKQSEARNLGSRYAQEFELVYQPAEGQAAPAKLVYAGWRSAVVDVPFTLKDLPLP